MPEQSDKKKAVKSDPADATGNRSVPQTPERKIPEEGSFRKADADAQTGDKNELKEGRSAGQEL